MAVTAKPVTIGLTEIAFGDVQPDGSMPAVMTPLGVTNEGTCKFTTEDGETTDFFCEELDDPIHTETKPGKTTLTFSIADADVNALQKVFGGTVTGSGSTAKWEAPAQSPNIEMAVKLTPKQGLAIGIYRGKVQGKMNAEYSKKNLFLIDVTVTVLPNVAGKKFSLYPKA